MKILKHRRPRAGRLLVGGKELVQVVGASVILEGTGLQSTAIVLVLGLGLRHLWSQESFLCLANRQGRCLCLCLCVCALHGIDRSKSLRRWPLLFGLGIEFPKSKLHSIFWNMEGLVGRTRKGKEENSSERQKRPEPPIGPKYISSHKYTYIWNISSNDLTIQ